MVQTMSKPLIISCVQLDHAKDLPLPGYESDAAAGMDLRVALDTPVTLAPGERGLLPTGLKLSIPIGYEVQIRPRSGLAIKHGITMLNSPGTIDADFRGELHLIAINHGQASFTIHHGDRMAQMVVQKVEQARLNPVRELDETQRGEQGFGSTGVS
jgi:dUTP pyrophosphatase